MDGCGGAVLVGCGGGGVLVGLGRPPLSLVGVRVAGENVAPGTEVLVADDVGVISCVAVLVVSSGVGVGDSSLHRPGPVRPLLYS